MPKYKMPDVPRTKKQIEIAERRKTVVELYFGQGMSAPDIAEQLGIPYQTIWRDVKFLEQEENRERAAKAVAVQQSQAEFRAIEDPDKRREALLSLVRSEKTYQQISIETGLSVQSIARDLNEFVREFAMWGGRTVEDWRDQQLLELDNLFVSAMVDARMEPYRDEEGNWEITPVMAANIRNKARQTAIKIQQRRASLIGMDQQKQEIEIEKRVVVASVGGIDLDEL